MPGRLTTMDLAREAVTILARITRAFEPLDDKVNAHMVVESAWFRKNLMDARAVLNHIIDEEGGGEE
jgi:hypothetical protein